MTEIERLNKLPLNQLATEYLERLGEDTDPSMLAALQLAWVGLQRTNIPVLENYREELIHALLQVSDWRDQEAALKTVLMEEEETVEDMAEAEWSVINEMDPEDAADALAENFQGHMAEDDPFLGNSVTEG